MKIVFICGSLEPGRDGVGDYVRRLSEELSMLGHHILIVALNDQYTYEAIFDDNNSKYRTLTSIRIPSTWKLNRKFDYAKHLIKEFNPDWISLQFVPFAFHTKGLPTSLASLLSSIGNNSQWHIMFHELWVGMNKESPLKMKLWGKLQMYLIKNLVLKLKPKTIHTQSRLYHSQLLRIECKSEVLPLFTNISNLIHRKDGNDSISDNINLVIFGSIHPNAPVSALAKDAALYAKEHRKSITLNFVGRCGPEQQHWADICEAAGLFVNILGEQTEKNISQILHKSNLGITTTPLALVEKSGTVAAMREHGLPVLCVAHPWTPSNVQDILPPSNVFLYESGNFGIHLIDKIYTNAQNTPSEIALKLIKDYNIHTSTTTI